jgi:hypothetical protein
MGKKICNFPLYWDALHKGINSPNNMPTQEVITFTLNWNMNSLHENNNLIYVHKFAFDLNYSFWCNNVKVKTF